MAVNWDEIQEAYGALLEARGEGQTAVLQRIDEMTLALNIAMDAHVVEIVTEDRWSWQRVGDALGITRQAASKRWRRKAGQA